MLGIRPSGRLPCCLTAARADARRNLDAANRVRLIFTARCTGGEGDTTGGITGVIAGGGIAGTLAALPMPLGSLTEPFSPRAFAGPGGMPLTPASWAGDLRGRREDTRPPRAPLFLSSIRVSKQAACASWTGDSLSGYIREELASTSPSSKEREQRVPGRPILSIVSPCFGQTGLECGPGRHRHKRKSAGRPNAGNIGLSTERQCIPR
jgi:hypothetical protein